jgi:hypothetical protein
MAPFLHLRSLLGALLMTVFALGSTKKLGKLSTAVEIGLAMIPFIVFSYFGRLFQHETQVGFWIFWVTAILVLTFTLQLSTKSSQREWVWAVYRSYVAQKVVAAMVLVFTFSIFLVSRQTNLFTEQARSAQTYNLGEIYPRLEGLYSNRQTYEDYLQMNQIAAAAAARFQRPVVVMPNFPLFYFLEGKRNPMTVDWWNDGDTQPHREKLQAELLQKNPLILFQKCLSVYEEGCDPDSELVPQWVLNHSKVLIETGRFSLVTLQ